MHVKGEVTIRNLESAKDELVCISEGLNFHEINKLYFKSSVQERFNNTLNKEINPFVAAVAHVLSCHGVAKGCEIACFMLCGNDGGEGKGSYSFFGQY